MTRILNSVMAAQLTFVGGVFAITIAFVLAAFMAAITSSSATAQTWKDYDEDVEAAAQLVAESIPIEEVIGFYLASSEDWTVLQPGDEFQLRLASDPEFVESINGDGAIKVVMHDHGLFTRKIRDTGDWEMSSSTYVIRIEDSEGWFDISNAGAYEYKLVKATYDES